MQRYTVYFIWNLLYMFWVGGCRHDDDIQMNCK